MQEEPVKLLPGRHKIDRSCSKGEKRGTILLELGRCALQVHRNNGAWSTEVFAPTRLTSCSLFLFLFLFLYFYFIFSSCFSFLARKLSSSRSSILLQEQNGRTALY